jgi:adenine-specific DNA-methyltransferase
VLRQALQQQAPDFVGDWAVYGARSRFDKAALAAQGLVFHQLPYDLAVKTWF